MPIHLQTPLTKQMLGQLKAGDEVWISGTIYTARDAAHARIVAAMEAGEALPFDLQGATIYYAGPTPNRPGRPVGALGPTTSGRMDAFAPALLDAGLCAMIGKGERNQAVREAVVRNGAVYFAAMGGAGALLARAVKAREVIAYPDLQSEAVARLTVENFPCLVALDAHGGNAYMDRPQAYRQTLCNRDTCAE